MNHDLNAQVVARVRDAVDVLEVIGDHVRLKRKGRRWEGLCPFHEEKTPSFSVDPDKGLYHCFGCHAGGDIISFVMKLENLSFPETVERLARRFGVQLPTKSPEEKRRQDRADHLRSLLEEAQHWLAARLKAADGGLARRELERRGFDEASWREFGFGYAPDDWRELISDMSRRHPEGSIVAAGLAVQPEGGKRPYDRFRKRLTFPIRATDGRLIAFGGRILGDGEPKYLNSPESQIFAKRSTLFCLDRARRAISDAAEVIVVEGYFDCLSLHRVGIPRTVATLGTALTSEHARLLRRLLGPEGRVVLCYDADPAGLRAAATGARVLLEAGVGVAVVVMEAGKDPDDIVREQGVEAMTAMVEEPTPILEFLMRDLPADPAERRHAGLRLAPLVCGARDPAVRQNLVEELARLLYLRPHDIEEQGRQPGRERPQPQAQPGFAPVSAPGEHNLVRIVLECDLEWLRTISDAVDVEHLQDPRVRAVLEAVAAMLEAGEAGSDQQLDSAALLQRLDEAGCALVAELANSELPEVTEEVIRQQLRVFKRQAREKAMRLLPLIEQAEMRGDDEEVRRLQAEQARLRKNFPKF